MTAFSNSYPWNVKFSGFMETTALFLNQLPAAMLLSINCDLDRAILDGHSCLSKFSIPDEHQIPTDRAA
jgi:hypothetical protein